jgi:hypothetical protein
MSGKRIELGVVLCALALAGACSEDSGSNGTGGAGSAGTVNAPATGAGGTTATGTGGTTATGTGGTTATGTAGTDTGTGTAGTGTGTAGTGTGTAGTGTGTAGTGTGTAGTDGGGGDVMCATTDVLEGSCKSSAEGVYAIKTEIDVWWQDDITPPIVDPGRGKITVYLMGDLTEVCDDGSNGRGVIRGCGTELPPFVSYAACDAFQISFPDELWDQPTMPTFTTTGSTTGFEPGDVLSLAEAAGLVGISLNDVNATWPTPMETGNVTCPEGSGADCFPDHDGDGNPGISV